MTTDIVTDFSITINGVHSINAGMVATLAAWGNGEQVCSADLVEALMCGLESVEDFEDLIVESQKYPALEATLNRFKEFTESKFSS